MNSSEKEKAIFRNLFVKSVDGQITQEEVQQFNALLSAYPDLEDYYIQCVRLQVGLREIRIFTISIWGMNRTIRTRRCGKNLRNMKQST